MPTVSAPILTTAQGPNIPSALLEALRKVEQHAQGVSAAVNSSLVLGDTLQVWTTANAAALKVTTPAAWVAPTFTNSWVNFSAGFTSAGYMQDAMGRWSLRGVIKNGVWASSAFTLPAAARPAANLRYWMASSAAGSDAGAFVEVRTDGSVVPGGTSGSNAFVFLDGISWSLDAPAPYVPSCFPLDLPLALKATPQFVLVTATETSAQFDPLTSPANLALCGADFIAVTLSSGQRLLRIRNVPGLLPSKTYALAVCAFGGG